jgi:hypothetical protein
MVSAWRIKNPDKPFSASAIELAEQILRRSDEVERIGKFGPSSGGDCERQLVMSFMGYPSKAPDNLAMLNRFQDGNYGHLMWQMVMWDMGILEVAEFPIEVVRWGVAGTCDGIVAIPDWRKVDGGYDPRMSRQDVRDIVESGDVPVRRLVLEIKRANDFRWNMMRSRGEPEQKVVWQGNLYYHGAREVTGDDTIKGVCYWLENKDNNDIVEYDLVPTDSNVALMEKFYRTKVLNKAAVGKLPPRPFEREEKYPRGHACGFCWQRERCDRWDDKGKRKIKPHQDRKLGKFAKRAFETLED